MLGDKQWLSQLHNAVLTQNKCLRPVSWDYPALCTVINSSRRFDSNRLRSKYSRSPLLCQHLWSWGGGGRAAVVLRPVAVLVLTGPNRIRTPAGTATTTERKWKKLWHREVVVAIIHVCAAAWIQVWHMQGLLGVRTCMCSNIWVYTHVAPECGERHLPPLFTQLHAVCFHSCIVGHHCRAAPAPNCQTRLLGLPSSLLGVEHD